MVNLRAALSGIIMPAEFFAVIAGRLASCGLGPNVGGYVMAANTTLGRQDSVFTY